MNKKLLLLPTLLLATGLLAGCGSFSAGYKDGRQPSHRDGTQSEQYLTELKSQPHTTGLVGLKDSALLQAKADVCAQRAHGVPASAISANDTFETRPELWRIVVRVASRHCA